MLKYSQQHSCNLIKRIFLRGNISSLFTSLDFIFIIDEQVETKIRRVRIDKKDKANNKLPSHFYQRFYLFPFSVSLRLSLYLLSNITFAS